MAHIDIQAFMSEPLHSSYVHILFVHVCIHSDIYIYIYIYIYFNESYLTGTVMLVKGTLHVPCT